MNHYLTEIRTAQRNELPDQDAQKLPVEMPKLYSPVPQMAYQAVCTCGAESEWKLGKLHAVESWEAHSITAPPVNNPMTHE